MHFSSFLAQDSTNAGQVIFMIVMVVVLIVGIVLFALLYQFIGLYIRALSSG